MSNYAEANEFEWCLKMLGTVQRIQSYIWETKNVTKIPSVDAMLKIADVQDGYAVFDFQDERILMYMAKEDGVHSMVINSPAVQGVSEKENYTVEDAIWGLFWYAGLDILSIGEAAPKAGAEICAGLLDTLADQEIWEPAPYFADVYKLFVLTKDCYNSCCWSET